MPLRDVLRSAHLVLDLPADDKWAAIARLCDHAAAAGALPAAHLAAARALVEERERSLSTGLEKGLAIPHAFVPGLDATSLVLAKLVQGVAWEALDGHPVVVAVLILAPSTADARRQHLELLAQVSGFWAVPEKRNGVLAAGDARALRAVVDAWAAGHP